MSQLSDFATTDPNRRWLMSMAESGGAALTNAGSHWIDLLRYLLGEIVEVYGRVSHKAGGFEVEDTTALQLVTQAGTLVTMAVTIQCPVPTNELEILGTKGRILANPLSDGRLTLWRGRGEPEQLHFPREGATHAGLLAALVPALKSGGPSPVPGEDAVAVWRVIEAGFAASSGGRRIELVAPSA